MLSVLLKPKDGFFFYFELTDGRCVSGGGLGEDGLLRSDVPDCYRDLMLRALVSKCMNDFVPEVRARGECPAVPAKTACQTICCDLCTPVLRNSTHSATLTAWSPRRSRYLVIMNRSKAVVAS